MAGEAVYFELFDQDTAGLRPTGLVEPRGPLGRVQQHIVEHADEICPFVQILDAPVPQFGDQLVAVLRAFDFAGKVPKMSRSSRRPVFRFAPMKHQTAEQLVEVPTIVSFSSLHGLMEQNADIPVPHRRGGRGGVEVFKVYAQDRIQLRLVDPNTLTFQFREVEVFLVFAQDRIQQRLVEPNTLTFQFREVEVFLVFAQDRIQQRLVDPNTLTFQFREVEVFLVYLRPGQVSTASFSHSPGDVDEALLGFFELFPKIKSAKIGPRSGSELSADFSSSTPASHLAHVYLGPLLWRDEAGFEWVQKASGGTG